MFDQWYTGTRNFYNEDVERFGNAYAEGYLSFWAQETLHMVPLVTPPSLLADLPAYHSSATERGWFL